MKIPARLVAIGLIVAPGATAIGLYTISTLDYAQQELAHMAPPVAPAMVAAGMVIALLTIGAWLQWRTGDASFVDELRSLGYGTWIVFASIPVFIAWWGGTERLILATSLGFLLASMIGVGWLTWTTRGRQPKVVARTYGAAAIIFIASWILFWGFIAFFVPAL